MINEPFIGAEALDRGIVRKHQLRSSEFRALHPGVYIRRDVELTMYRRARAAWLWSHRLGVIAGLTAAALHGARWVDDAEPIELISLNAQAAPGIRTSGARIRKGEFTEINGMWVTSPPRTAFDLARRGPLETAVGRLDALAHATHLHTSSVVAVAARHPGVRGIRQLRTALDLYDPGAESPRESWLRVTLIKADFPRPRTQIPVLRLDGRSMYYLDMGWEERMLAVEYDGDHHRTDPVRYAYDIKRAEELAALGWTVIRVIRGDRAPDTVRRVERIWSSRLR